MTEPRAARYEWHRRRSALMPYRVLDVLLLSSDYDAFVLEEDGPLGDRIFRRYTELSLSAPPRITHTSDAERALELLGQRRFDLVVTVPRIGEFDVARLAPRLRAKAPRVPIVVLVFDESDGAIAASAGHVLPFFWTGSATSLIAAIKLVEDHANVDHDTRVAGVRVLLVVEDGVRAYSSLLAQLYPELLAQASSLIAEGYSDYHRITSLCARPKIVLARSYDEGLARFYRHRDYLSAVLTDIRLPSGAALAPDAGLELARRVREAQPDLPLLIESAETSRRGEAERLGAWFLDKDARDFRGELRGFLRERLGFGEFVFRLPTGEEVGRARDLFAMEELLLTVDDASLVFHGQKNDFSTWLMARGMFELAEQLRPRTVGDFSSVDALRAELIRIVAEARRREEEGVVTELSAHATGPATRFGRVGSGSVGGKGRGIAFVGAMLARYDLVRRFPGLEIRIPKTVILGTELIEPVTEHLARQRLDGASDAEITQLALAVPLSAATRAALASAKERLHGPLAVRSSSAHEDSRFHPFAGVFATYRLPNNHPSATVRELELEHAIKAVAASAFQRRARAAAAGVLAPGERGMAVIVQRIVGRRFGDRYYPFLSGVLESFNFYPAGGQSSHDGVACVALGLGHEVVGGGLAVRFCPASPDSSVEYPDARAYLETTQTELVALDLSRPLVDFSRAPDSSLTRVSLADAERDGVLGLAASVYSADDDVLRDGLEARGPRVVTFRNLLRYRSLPFCDALATLGFQLRQTMGEEVELELALDLPSLGVPGWATGDADPALLAKIRASVPRLYVLQLRPMSGRNLARDAPLHARLDSHELDRREILCASDRALGHGTIEDVADLVEVTATRLEPHLTSALVVALRERSSFLAAEQRPFLLVGPGRFGSADPHLGIGVDFADISGARVIVELPLAERRVEPSQGSHFFRNVTAARTGYVTVEDREGSFFDRSYGERLAAEGRAVAEGPGWRHVRLTAPLAIELDARRGTALILKPPPAAPLSRPFGGSATPRRCAP